MNKETNYKVYLHISPSNKVYVGITKQKVEKRWKNGRGYDYILRTAIDKYGWNNFQHIVLCRTDHDIACLLEKTLIHHYKRKKVSYNITDGGEGHEGVSNIWSEESKDKVSKSLKEYYKTHIHNMVGKHLSEETKHKISLGNIGKPPTNKTEEGMARWKKKMIGRKISEETKLKHSIVMKSKEVQDKRKKKVMKPIYQIDRTTNTIIKEWESATTAARELGLSQGHISNVLKGNRPQCGGYYWKYKNN